MADNIELKRSEERSLNSKLIKNTVNLDMVFFEIPSYFMNHSDLFITINDTQFYFNIGIDNRTSNNKKRYWYEINVPSDPSANYKLWSKTKMRNGNWNVVVRREGKSGISYTQREVNCERNTQRYLADGDLNSPYEAMDFNRPIPQSISGVIGKFVCQLKEHHGGVDG